MTLQEALELADNSTECIGTFALALRELAKEVRCLQHLKADKVTKNLIENKKV